MSADTTLKRDLDADLKLCEETQRLDRYPQGCNEDHCPICMKATSCQDCRKDRDGLECPLITFREKALFGWPHAILRAKSAEKRIEPMEAFLHSLSPTVAGCLLDPLSDWCYAVDPTRDEPDGPNGADCPYLRLCCRLRLVVLRAEELLKEATAP